MEQETKVNTSHNSSSSHTHSSHRSSPHHSHGASSHSHHSSHHSSSHHSSSSRKKKRSSTKSYDKLRTVFSFLLFLSIAVTSVFAGFKVSVLNENKIAQTFTSVEYVSALYNDVLEFSQDQCLKCGIPDSGIKDAVTYSSISEIQNAYTYGVLGLDEMYSESRYVDMIKDLNEDIVNAVKSTIKENNITVDESQKSDGMKKLANEITEYLTKKVEFSYISDIISITNVGNKVLDVGIALFAIFTVAFLLLTISFSEKKYRSVRAVCCSLFAASILHLFLVAFVGIVAIFKDLLVYPTYLCDAIMSYIKSCVSTFFFEGFCLFLIGVVISTLAWKMKRNND